LPDSLTNAAGEPINAVHGFAGFLHGLLSQTQASEVAVAFDESLTSSFRNEIYPDYKANREPAPEDLKRQFGICKALAQALGLYICSSDRYEADDLIASLATQAQARKQPVVIVSRDKDLAQLLTAEDRLWDFAGDIWMDATAVAAKFGVPPTQMLDYQALVGDAVDNIPGVKGIGPKAAVALLDHFGSLDAMLDRLDEVSALPLRGAKRLHSLLSEQRDMALMSRELCRMVTDIDMGAADLARRPFDVDEFTNTMQSLGLGPGLTQRLLSLG
ncbi:MAG: 5'-3' exonuclease, partial [Nevskiales bacterium]